jgi:hypothetical protein
MNMNMNMNRNICDINDLALKLVALDFSDGHMPNNGGPTKTSRALAIIHLAAHDAYAQVTNMLKPKLGSLPPPLHLLLRMMPRGLWQC